MALPTLISDARAAAKQIVQMARDPILAIWGLYLLAVPVYVFKSGVPQPGDYLIVLLMPMAIARRSTLASIARTPVRALFTFTAYVVTLNLIWSAVLGNWTFSPKEGLLLSPLFYTYNALMFLVVVILYQRYRERLLWLTAKLVLASLIIQVMVSSVNVTAGLRTLGLFNNANQLGFYALLSASILLLLQRRGYLSTLEISVGVPCAIYLCLLSASKAALGGIGLLAIFGTFVRLRTMLVIAAVLGLSLVVADPVLEAIERAVSRIENDNLTHSAIEERGYDRIVNNPEYLAIGAGEGAYTRFEETTIIGSHEIHSSLGTLAFCYGVPGLVLFGVFMWLVLRGSGFRTWLLVAPSFAFGMTHQGLRSTLFWVQLAIVVAIRWEMQEAKARKTKERRASSRSATVAYPIGL